MLRSKHKTLLLLTVLITEIMLLTGLPPDTRAAAQYYSQTVKAFLRLPGINKEKKTQGTELIKKLVYDNSRGFRRFCRIPGVTADNALKVLNIISTHAFNYDQMQAFGAICRQPDITIAAALKSLYVITTLPYAACRVVIAFCRVANGADNAAEALEIIYKLPSAAAWAGQVFLEIPNQTPGIALTGLYALKKSRGNEAWAAEAFFKLPDMTPENAIKGLALINKLQGHNAWFARSFFLLSKNTLPKSLSWLQHYFIKSYSEQEQIVNGLPDKDKTLLLTIYRNGRDNIIRKINDLHSITDPVGTELQESGLYDLTIEELREKFLLFSDKTREYIAPTLEGLTQKKDKHGLVQLLYKTTYRERRQVAKTCHDAEIYIILAHGSELYDSSFRDILVPELQNRIHTEYNGRLLKFLGAVDPENKFVSNFIISMAQRGKFTDFIAYNNDAQKRIIELMAFSAFQNKKNLLSFSATFMKLLRVVTPDTRHLIITKMAYAINTGNNHTLSKSLAVILQYYLTDFAKLLSPADRKKIKVIIQKRGTDNFDTFLATPFAQWRKDGVLRALSVFHADDDGEKTFTSYCRLLWQRGYRLRLSAVFCSYRPAPEDNQVYGKARKEIEGFVDSINKPDKQSFLLLFELLKKYRFPVDFVKTINGVDIIQSIYLYKDRELQEKILELFIKGKYEMFAQRGHSYWRKEQLLNPLREIITDGIITDDDLTDMHRFISIGSCGGMNSYKELNDFFQNNVDILATIGTGTRYINNLYNLKLFEIVAKNPAYITWKVVARQTAHIFKQKHGQDYIQPGTLPVILQKISNLE